MRAVIQRVSEASVKVNEEVTGSIGRGLLVFAGVEDADTDEDIKWLTGKIIGMRIFNDANGIMNLNVKDAGGNILLVSQFTLHASTKKGNRPSYIRASKADVAIPMYEKLVRHFEQQMEGKIQTGVFGADMKVSLLNDGPVTIIIDTKNRE